MKAGRNDPCPCGSGKKYKKCCLAKDQEASLRQTAAIPPPPSSVASPRLAPSRTEQHPKPAGRIAPARAAEVPTPPLPRDPVTERAEERWREFEVRDGEDRIVLFLETLEDAEVMEDDMAFEMLSVLHRDAVASGGRTRFAECVGALRERLPEVFDQGAHYYLSWCLLDALAEGRQEVVPSLARELAARAGRDIDTFNRAREALGYHGQLDVIVESLRIAWPLVKSSDNIVPWGISEFAERGDNHEIFDYLEHTASPDPADAVLLDRVHFFYRGAA
jgi:SEC-C motif